jgi:hypothetical protein
LIFLTINCSNVSANQSNYQLTLSKITKSTEVITYDKDKWKDSISRKEMPDDWFKGDPHKIGAKSKTTFKVFFDRKKSSSDLFFFIFDDFIPENVSLLLLLDEELYEEIEKDIDDKYDRQYKVWVVYYENWDYTTKEFKEEAERSNRRKFIFQDPEDYGKLLVDFNSWLFDINKTLNYYNLSVSPVSKKDFLWNLILDDLIIVNPFQKYLEDLMDGLNIKKVKIKEDTFIWERNGRKDYTVELEFGDQGFPITFIIRNNKGKIIYEIISSDSRPLIYVILGVSITIATFIVIVSIKRWKKIRSNDH